jgi:Ca2+-binding RTX toxin-like protein
MRTWDLWRPLLVGGMVAAMVVAVLFNSIASAAPAPKCRGETLTAMGTTGSDVKQLSGGRARDVVHLLPGDDWTATGSGKDVICGGRGDDILRAGRGRDWIEGGRGHNVIRCGRRNDVAVINEGDRFHNCETVLLRN